MVINSACRDITSFLVMDILERAHELEREGKRVIHLEIGEPDFDTPACVKEAAKKAIDDGKTHYTHSLGLIELRQAISEHYQREFGVAPDPCRIVVTGGVSPAMLLTFAALLHHGDEVILSDPSYACYPNFIRFQGATPAYAPVREEDGFQFTIDGLKPYIHDKTRAIIANSPSNPAGTVTPPETLKALCDLGPTLISDEIYQGLIYEGKGHSALEFSDDCFVLNGFSKLFAMTGWRLGYLIAPQKYLPTIQKLQQNFFICAGSVAQWAGVAALREAGEDVERMRQTYAKRRRFLIDGLKALGFAIPVEPTGAFYVMVNAKHLGENSLALAYDILEKVHLGVTPGIDFGPGGEGHLRFSYANSIENIEEGLVRLKTYLEMRC
jgi:(5-formylfuran-3-yl)methyl phosphate transaminase